MIPSVTFRRKGKAKDLLVDLDKFIDNGLSVARYAKMEYDILYDAVIPADKYLCGQNCIPYRGIGIFRIERK